jgi:hypothetical protein
MKIGGVGFRETSGELTKGFRLFRCTHRAAALVALAPHTRVTTNMPAIFAGGGFKHGQHLAFNTEHNYPLQNLFVSMLQRMGLETDKFASVTGMMRGLELA